MKKVLSFIAMAIFATAISAQEIGRKPSNASEPHHRTVVSGLKKIDLDREYAKPGTLTLTNGKALKALDISMIDMKTLKPIGIRERQIMKYAQTGIGRIVPSSFETVTSCNSKNFLHPAFQGERLTLTESQMASVKPYANRTINKAAKNEIQYTGHGEDFETKKEVTWNSFFSVAKTSDGEVNVFVDPAPNYFKGNGLDNVSVTYTEDNGVITIPAQPIYEMDDEGTKLYVIISSTSTTDGSIILNIDENGKITTASSMSIMYGAWTSPEFDPTYKKKSKGGKYVGYYQFTSNVSYTYEGQAEDTPVDETGFSTILSYTTSGVSLQTEKTDTWKTIIGTRTIEGQKYNAIRNIIKNCFAEDGIDNVDLGFKAEEPYLMIPVQTILKMKSKSGDYFYIMASDVNSADGSIRLTLDNDGNLSVSDSAVIAYSVWSENEYDPDLKSIDDNGTFCGFYAAYASVKFTSGDSGNTGGDDDKKDEDDKKDDEDKKDDDNKEDTPTESGYTTSYKYTGCGKTYGSETFNPLTWNAEIGKKSSNGKTINVMRCPLPKTDAFSVDVEVEYTREDNTITILPQAVAKNSKYYIIFFSGNSEDGSIKMTIDSNGKLTTDEEEFLLYGAWTSATFDPKYTTYKGYFTAIENVKYINENENYTPTVMYEPEGLVLHVGPSESGYQYSRNMAIAPADAKLSLKNYTSDPIDKWNWEAYSIDNNQQTKLASGTERNFSCDLKGGKTYAWPKLNGTFIDNTSAVYQYAKAQEGGEEPHIYSGGTSYDYSFTDGTEATLSKVNPDNGIASAGFLATPDANTSDYKIQNLISYQGIPTAPLYTEGIRLMVRKFNKQKDFKLTCKLVKVSYDEYGEKVFGGTIAESTTCTVKSSDITALDFSNFYVYDDNGLTRTVDHLFINEEFAVMFEGWGNGTFSCYPYMEDEYNENGTPAIWVDLDLGQSVARRALNTLYNHLYVGFIGATYGYIRGEETAKSVMLPGTASSKVVDIEPMIYDNDAIKGATTRLFLDETSDNPEWLTISVESEHYTDDLHRCSLKFSAKALPENIARRTANIVIYQEGAQFKFTVTQDSRTQDTQSATDIQDIELTDNAQNVIYNTSGLRLNKMQKGINILNGKKILR